MGILIERVPVLLLALDQKSNYSSDKLNFNLGRPKLS